MGEYQEHRTPIIDLIDPATHMKLLKLRAELRHEQERTVRHVSEPAHLELLLAGALA